MVISRYERMLCLQNGDRILLPINELWSGYARVSVDRVYDMPLHYQVTIRTKDDQSLSTKIERLARTYGPGFAVNAGLAIVAPEAVIGRAVVSGTIALMRPTPLNEGEGVFWRIPSARNGVVDVWIINER